MDSAVLKTIRYKTALHPAYSFNYHHCYYITRTHSPYYYTLLSSHSPQQISSITQKFTKTNLEDTTDSSTMASCYIGVAGKVYAPGLLLPQDAVLAARFIWPQLKQDNRWRFYLRGLDNNIYAIEFESEDDRNSILYAGAWNFDGYTVVLKLWDPSMDYKRLNFSLAPFWMECKYLLPEFYYSDVIKFFAEIMGELIIMEPEAERPILSSKVKALVHIHVSRPHLTGLTVVSAAGVPRWVGLFYAGQPYHLCPDCKVIDHDATNCLQNKQLRMQMETQQRNINHLRRITAVQAPADATSLYRQHSRPRRSILRPLPAQIPAPPTEVIIQPTLQSDQANEGIRKRHRPSSPSTSDVSCAMDITEQPIMPTVWVPTESQSHQASTPTDACHQAVRSSSSTPEDNSSQQGAGPSQQNQ